MLCLCPVSSLCLPSLPAFGPLQLEFFAEQELVTIVPDFSLDTAGSKLFCPEVGRCANASFPLMSAHAHMPVAHMLVLEVP